MATTASFKQQCPSCEAMVPIRDPKLIGRKIDCPKCKYRFVVEDPGTSAEEETPRKKRRGEDDDPRAKGKPVRRRDEDDEGDEEADGAKKPAGNSKLILGVGLSVVALGLLGVVAYLLFSGDSGSSSTKSASGSGGSSSSSSASSRDENQTKEGEPAKEVVAASASKEFLTNLLPPDIEGVCTVHFQDLMKTAIGRAMFDSAGSFRPQALQEKLGFSVSDVDVIVQGWNFSQNWSLNVVHTTAPVNVEAVKATLRAKPAEKGEGLEYFVLEANPWLDMLGRASFGMLFHTNSALVPARSGPLALCIYDAQTLIFGDVNPIKGFASHKGVFEHKAPDTSTAKKDEEAPKGGEEGSGGKPGPNNMAGMMGKMGGGPPGMGGRGGMGGPAGPGGNPAAAEQNKPEEAGPSGSYLTISDAGLKTMLDRVEAKQPVISLALNTLAAVRSRMPFFGVDVLKPGPDDADVGRFFLKTLFQDANIVGAALLLKDGVLLTLGTSYGNEDDALKHAKSIQKNDAGELASRLSKALDSKVAFVEPDPNEQAFGGSQGGQGGTGPGMMGMMGRGGMGRGAPSGPMMPGVGGGQGGKPPVGGMMGPRGGGGNQMTPDEGMGMMRGMMGRGMMGNQQQTEPKEKEKPGSTVKVSTPEKNLILISIHLIDETANSSLVNNRIRQALMQRKGELDMAGARLRVHEVGVAVRSYPESPPHQGVFPRGTANRDIPSSREGRPYPPDLRVSWMADLLPYLGPEQAALVVDRQKSWQDKDGNAEVAGVLVPQFLDPAYPPSSFWVRHAGSDRDAATTHFVGIAGVGLDAAEYAAGDPAVANKLGIFGYDRVTRLDDVKDKTSHTILMAQVPPYYKRPWLAGGGATVMGVPETGSIRPFVSTQREGKRGTHVVMADGSVRFITENVSDEVFKALCTISGGETVNLNRDAPLVPPPEGQPELKVVAPITAPPPSPRTDTKPSPSTEAKPNARKSVDNEKVVAAFSTNCGMCHTGPRSKGRVQIFTSPGEFNQDVPRDKIAEVLANGKMPKPPRRISAEDLAVLQGWLSGAK
jgi:Protein of unknown function (DUF1559)